MTTRRSTRKRVVVAVDTNEQTEADADFWGQDAFAEDGEDEEFDEKALSDAGEDIVDSDFDAPENDGTGGTDSATRERELRAGERASATARRKSRSAYVDPASRRRKRRASESAGAGTPKRAATAATTTTTTTTPPPARDRSSLRNSTKRASAEAAASRALRAEQEEKRRVKKAERDAKRPQIRVPTQEELLAEAKETEVANKESLKDLLKLEEERKRVPVRTAAPKSHMLSLRDRGGAATVSITDADADARDALFPHLAEEKHDN